MTYDPGTPAREKTAFGNFELRRTHLKTGVKKVALLATRGTPTTDPVTAAQRTIAARAVGGSFEQECADTAALLDLLGINYRVIEKGMS